MWIHDYNKNGSIPLNALDQYCPQSLCYFFPADGATDALEESKPEPQNPGSSLIVLCKIVYPFDQEKFSREISLLTHIYN